MAKIQINWQLLRDLCSKVSQISRQAIMACFKLRESAVIVRKLGVEIVPCRAGGTACAQVAEATGESWILSILLIKKFFGLGCKIKCGGCGAAHQKNTPPLS
ncbi:MAG: hypothetical protein J6N71_11645 [Muribaculaceae bacterium]|nr:hypothetical protein [Muribaculaceae bacterium]